MWPGVAGCGWMIVAVGSQLGSQLGYPGHHARKNASALRRPPARPQEMQVVEPIARFTAR